MMRTASAHPAFWQRMVSRRIGSALGIIFGLLFLIGCKPREVVRATPYMQSDPNTWVRVLLYHNVPDCNLQSDQPLTVKDNRGRILTTDATGEPVRFHVAAGHLMVNERGLDALDVQVSSKAPFLIVVQGQPFRGRVRILADAQQATLDVINEVPMEPYLAGVVGAEMPPYWEPEALKAQAMVARTYCLYIKHRFGANRPWDLSRTQAHQVYRGVQAESASIWDAVNQTAGQILKMPDQNGRLKIFPTYYSAVCGGHTEAAQHVFGGNTAPLVGVPCPYCAHVALMNQYLWPMACFSKDEVDKRLRKRYPSLRKLGHIVHIVPIQQSDYQGFSRLTRIQLVGETGRRDTLRAEDLRLTIDPSGRKIKSTICRIEDWKTQWAFVDGRGWGHGVGLCQCGAQGMARQGSRAAAILLHYFPHAVIKKIEP